MNSVCIKSYAKLNLYLRVIKKRKDRYHNITTLFERISLYDRIKLTARKDKKVNIICDYPNLPSGKSNLAYQAAYLIRKNLSIDNGVNIEIKKRIPLASGLGGGSSNAAAVLLGLNRLWNLNLSKKKLVSFAELLGADVPFFICASAFALGSRRGDRIKAIDIKNRFWHVLVVPKLKVTTESVYKQFDQIYRSNPLRLTNPLDDVKMLLLRLRNNNVPLIKKAIFNHLEVPAFKIYPCLQKIRNRLLKIIPKDNISMSGSGPAMFVFVSSRKEGERLCRQLGKIRHWRTFLVRTF